MNDIPIKTNYSIPLIDQFFDHSRNASVFSKIDLISGYHQVPNHEEDRYKTAFLIHSGQYQQNVIFIDLTDASATV